MTRTRTECRQGDLSERQLDVAHSEVDTKKRIACHRTASGSDPLNMPYVVNCYEFHTFMIE
jgi:hypothetical protein